MLIRWIGIGCYLYVERWTNLLDDFGALLRASNCFCTLCCVLCLTTAVAHTAGLREINVVSGLFVVLFAKSFYVILAIFPLLLGRHCGCYANDKQPHHLEVSCNLYTLSLLNINMKWVTLILLGISDRPTCGLNNCLRVCRVKHL